VNLDERSAAVADSEVAMLMVGGALGMWAGYLVGIWRGACRAARASSRTVRGRR
jgi:membrane protein DedA with SNARE-associated domain